MLRPSNVSSQRRNTCTDARPQVRELDQSRARKIRFKSFACGGQDPKVTRLNWIFFQLSRVLVRGKLSTSGHAVFRQGGSGRMQGRRLFLLLLLGIGDREKVESGYGVSVGKCG